MECNWRPVLGALLLAAIAVFGERRGRRLPAFGAVRQGPQNLPSRFKRTFLRILHAADVLEGIRSLTIDSLRPLTGAEEIDLVYSPCASGPDDWQVAHYSNRENVYHLERNTFAHKLSVVSPTDISIIDVGVQPCENEYGTVQLHLKKNGTGFCEVVTTAAPMTSTSAATVTQVSLDQAEHRHHRHRVHPHRTIPFELPGKENRENVNTVNKGLL
ncbi:hypothetical protein L596_027955 [Steinernema carpocapsae]|uniref:Uncharacterized protein n=1 Tax=Steinernema carpocapsae TaxID=34508 RepID=A0A4U5LX17_STECR|nr:hypothetical protein L596_027955 [Steinernema carpocapsae]